MSLFAQLRRLYRSEHYRVEDIHTEIVAQVLRNSEKLTLEWLRGIGVTDLEKPDHVEIATQEQFEKLAGHSTDSRPDIAIRLVASGKTELILIESKLGSTQGPTQLQRYADHLADSKHRGALEKTSLVFITKNYEAAPESLKDDPRFHLERWFHFYKYLKAHVNGDGLAKELKLFMEENRMSLGNKFRTTDLIAMENFTSARAIMNETLQGEVFNAAWKVLGKMSSLKKAMEQLRQHNRYIIYAGLGAQDLYCLAGYFFPREHPDESIWVGIHIESNPNSKIRQEVIKAFRGWIEKSGKTWVASGLDGEKEWSRIYKGEKLQSFMAKEDHVRAVKDYLLGLLEEVRQFQRAYPNLPWSVSISEPDDEAEEGPK